MYDGPAKAIEAPGGALIPQPSNEGTRPMHDTTSPTGELPPGLGLAGRLKTALEMALSVIDEHARQAEDATAEADDPDEDGTEPYCTACGEWTGIFHGMEGWHHFRGDPSPGGRRTLYDAGHEAVPGWCRPPGMALSPAGLRTLAQALEDAQAYRQDRGAVRCPDCGESDMGLCEDHGRDFGKLADYRELVRQLTAGDVLDDRTGQ